MEIDSIIRIHELSSKVDTASLDYFSSQEIKKDLLNLVSEFEEEKILKKKDIEIENYSGFVLDNENFIYLNQGKEFLSVLRDIPGFESGLLTFKNSFSNIEYRVNFDYFRGRKSSLRVEGENSKWLESLVSLEEEPSVGSPSRNVSFHGERFNWTFFQVRENSGSFNIFHPSKAFYFSFQYREDYDIGDLNEFKELFFHLKKFTCLSEIKKFFSGKTSLGNVLDYSRGYLDVGTDLEKIFD